jgi:hypothetical protein
VDGAAAAEAPLLEGASMCSSIHHVEAPVGPGPGCPLRWKLYSMLLGVGCAAAAIPQGVLGAV